MNRLLGSLLAVLAFCASAGAHAHHIWIEADAQGATLHFGYYERNLRETSPGLLDNFGSPAAAKHSAGGSTAVPLRKTAAGFVIDARLKPGESLTAEDAAYPISERKEGEQVTRSLYHPAARFVGNWAEQEPRLKLDLVPTGKAGKDGVELRASFNGQPLPKARLLLLTASGWARDFRTGDDGTITVPLPWRGPYVVRLSHSDASGGERAGQKFDRATYVTSLTLLQPTGLAPLPPVPAAQPNKPH